MMVMTVVASMIVDGSAGQLMLSTSLNTRIWGANRKMTTNSPIWNIYPVVIVNVERLKVQASGNVLLKLVRSSDEQNWSGEGRLMVMSSTTGEATMLPATRDEFGRGSRGVTLPPFTRNTHVVKADGRPS